MKQTKFSGNVEAVFMVRGRGYDNAVLRLCCYRAPHATILAACAKLVAKGRVVRLRIWDGGSVWWTWTREEVCP